MSKQWNKLIFQKNDENYVELCRNIQNQFHEIRMSSGCPVEMALFSRDDNYKTETFYFSPACNHYAPKFLKEISAIPCDHPDHSGLGLLDGDASSRVAILGEKAAIEMPPTRQK
jgi:hypothetical protein